MPSIFVGDVVQTPLGKGVVSDVRRSGDIVVRVGDRAVVVPAEQATPIVPSKKSSKKRKTAPTEVGESHGNIDTVRDGRAVEIDLHGLTVADALARVESAVNDALLDGHARVRLIHGRSGGRIKAALHRQLKSIPSVRAFRIDPANEGVTIVEF